MLRSCASYARVRVCVYVCVYMCVPRKYLQGVTTFGASNKQTRGGKLSRGKAERGRFSREHLTCDRLVPKDIANTIFVVRHANCVNVRGAVEKGEKGAGKE